MELCSQFVEQETKVLIQGPVQGPKPIFQTPKSPLSSPTLLTTFPDHNNHLGCLLKIQIPRIHMASLLLWVWNGAWVICISNTNPGSF